MRFLEPRDPLLREFRGGEQQKFFIWSFSLSGFGFFVLGDLRDERSERASHKESHQDISFPGEGNDSHIARTKATRGKLFSAHWRSETRPSFGSRLWKKSTTSVHFDLKVFWIGKGKKKNDDDDDIHLTRAASRCSSWYPLNLEHLFRRRKAPCQWKGRTKLVSSLVTKSSVDRFWFLMPRQLILADGLTFNEIHPRNRGTRKTVIIIFNSML